MIKKDDVFKIGKLLKPHGIKGEIAFAFDNDIFDRVSCPYLICLLDGILVPFFIEEYRFKGEDTALVKFEDMDSDKDVSRLNNTEVYFPREYFEDNSSELNYTWNYFIGFKIVDIASDSIIGVIDSVDESTINILFVVSNGDDEYLIPASEDFIKQIDDKNKILKMNLPEGLLD